MHQTLEEGGVEKDLAVGVAGVVFLVFVSCVFVGGSLGHLVCFPWLFGPSCFFGGSLGHVVALWVMLFLT